MYIDSDDVRSTLKASPNFLISWPNANGMKIVRYRENSLDSRFYNLYVASA